MDSTYDGKLRAIWKQTEIPVIYRTGKKEPMMLKLPYDPDNRQWLRQDKTGRHPVWNSKYKCWLLPRTRFDEMVEALLDRFHRTYVIQPYREKEICAPACWNAKGFTCECSCMGANHGRGNAGTGWFEISETLAVQWGPKKYGCRLLKLRGT